MHGWLKGKKLPASIKNKISRALTGKKRSDKACLSNSKAKKGVPLSKTHKDSLSKANTGCHFWNNGLICVYRKECPEGFKSGMLKKRKNT